MSALKPNVDHHFNGDSKILNATLDRRSEIRNVLANLQKELQRLEGHPVQIEANIRFNILGPVAKEHVYSVNVTDPTFDSALFTRTKTPAGSSGSAASPAASSRAGGRRPSSRDDGDIRPPKRARVEGDDGSVLGETTSSQRIDEVFSFIKGWHDEWTRQGGWLFDTLNAVSKAQKDDKEAVHRKLDTVQDILGQSINSSTASTMAELANIAKLVPWLEHCRKTAADKVQAREEKWRSSSATFHDQSRRDRDAAEKRLEDKLEAQRQLLIKVAEANGIDIDEDDKQSETSLGAQLTAELNLEALRAAGNGRGNSTQDTIEIDD